MLRLSEGRCNRGHKQYTVIEMNKTKVSRSQQYEWELRIASWQVHVFFIGQKVWNMTCSAKTSAPAAGQQLFQVPRCGVDVDSLLQWAPGDQSCLQQRGLRHRNSVTDFYWEHLDLRVLHLGHWAWETKLKPHMIFTFFAQYSPLMWGESTSTFTFLDTSSVQVRYHSLGENLAQSFFLFALWPSDSLTVLCILHLIPVINSFTDLFLQWSSP